MAANNGGGGGGGRQGNNQMNEHVEFSVRRSFVACLPRARRGHFAVDSVLNPTCAARRWNL